MAALDDITDLLTDAAQQFQVVCELHDKALEEPSMRGKFKTRAKNVLENYRSALDYLAVDITNRFGTPKGLIYYPMAPDEKNFEKAMSSSMPGVSNQAIRDAISRHQPYNSDWLRTLSQLVREQKHNRLTAQIIAETYQCRVTERATGASVSWYGLEMTATQMKFSEAGGGLLPMGGEKRDPSMPQMCVIAPSGSPTMLEVFGIPIEPATQRPYPNTTLEFESGPLHTWCFTKPHTAVVSALGFIGRGVHETVTDIAQAADR